MRELCAIAGLMAVLCFGSAQAFAFQQETPPPPAETPEAASQAPALELGTPGGASAASKAGQGGIKLFGHTFLPKLDFGLDVLYGEGQQQQQLELQQAPTVLDENGDVTVLGKVKRRF